MRARPLDATRLAVGRVLAFHYEAATVPEAGDAVEVTAEVGGRLRNLPAPPTEVVAPWIGRRATCVGNRWGGWWCGWRRRRARRGRGGRRRGWRCGGRGRGGGRCRRRSRGRGRRWRA